MGSLTITGMMNRIQIEAHQTSITMNRRNNMKDFTQMDSTQAIEALNKEIERKDKRIADLEWQVEMTRKVMHSLTGGRPASS